MSFIKKIKELSQWCAPLNVSFTWNYILWDDTIWSKEQIKPDTLAPILFNKAFEIQMHLKNEMMKC